MGELSKAQLWYPGQDFDLREEYPTITEVGLVEAWQEYTGCSQVELIPGVLGALKAPQEAPTSFASIDLCEVVRHTHRGLRQVENVSAGTIDDIHAYCHGLSIHNNADITTVAQVLIQADLIEPVDDIDHIASTLQAWRERGVFVFANTSTLEGCEQGTIDFLAKYLPDGFDGIAFPRNHDSTLPLTKGVVAANIIGKLSASGLVVAIHIDDKPAHNTAFLAALQAGGHHVGTFQPEYPSSHAADPSSIIADTPLNTFIAAGRFLLEQAK